MSSPYCAAGSAARARTPCSSFGERAANAAIDGPKAVRLLADCKERIDRRTKTPLRIGGYLLLTAPAACTIAAATCAYQFETTGAALTPATRIPARSFDAEASSCSVGVRGFAATAAKMLPSASKNAPVKTREKE